MMDKNVRKLYINMSLRVGHFLYFTSINSCNLYKMDIMTKEVYVEMKYPCELLGAPKFVKMISYGSKLWMIPCDYDEIVVYDLVSRTITSLRIPNVNIFCSYDTNFIEPIVDGKYLWLHLSDRPITIRLNMEQYSVCFYYLQSSSLKFNQLPEPCMESMVISDRGLYLFRDKSNKSIKIDLETNAIEPCEYNVCSRIGEKITEETVLFSPAQKGQSLLLLNLHSREEKQINLPEWIWGNDEQIQYVFIRVIGSYAYLLPYYANAIIKMHIQTKELKYISLTDMKADSLSECDKYSVWDLVNIDDEIWGIPYMGNSIIRISEQGDVVGQVNLSVFEQDFIPSIGIEIRKEIKSYGLREFANLDKVQHVELTIEHRYEIF